MIKEIKGNLIHAEEDVIAHQVNTQGVMGAGVAYQIRKKFPESYDAYVNFLSQRSNPLGELIICQCFNGRGKTKSVAHLFAQQYYGRDDKVVYTNYNALRKSLTQLKNYCQKNKYSVALPKYIGCGLAGGDWEYEVLPMIKEIFRDYDVTLYYL